MGFALHTGDGGKFRGSILDPQSGDPITYHKPARNPLCRKCPGISLKFLPCFVRMLIDWKFCLDTMK